MNQQALRPAGQAARPKRLAYDRSRLSDKLILDGDLRPDWRYLEASASSEECCIRKAVNERGLNSGPVGLADASSEDEAATGTAFAFMEIE